LPNIFWTQVSKVHVGVTINNKFTAKKKKKIDVTRTQTGGIDLAIKHQVLRKLILDIGKMTECLVKLLSAITWETNHMLYKCKAV
jgi:hypothetical protein